MLAALVVVGCDANREDTRYPVRPIKLVVPFAAGGETDTFARLFKKAIDENALLPQPLVIINVDGAGGTVGSRRVKNARPDGYTVLLLHAAILTAKYHGTVSYGPEAFTPVAATGEIGLIVAVRDDGPYSDLHDLLQAAHSTDDRPAFGANLGAPSHFAGLQLEGVDPEARFRFVQTGGGAKRFAALRGGHIDVSVFSVNEYHRFTTGGVRGVAYLGAERHAAAPDVPTATEQGFDVFNQDLHFWWMPKGTPRVRVERLATALEAACGTEYVRRKLAEVFCEPVFLNGERLERRIATLEKRIAHVITRRSTVVPNFAGLVLGSVAALVLLVLWNSRRCDAPAPRPADRAGWNRALACLTLIVVYVAVLSVEWLAFLPATFAYIVSTGCMLTDSWRRALPALIVLAAAMSCGLHFVFTHIFVIDLP